MASALDSGREIRVRDLAGDCVVFSAGLTQRRTSIPSGGGGGGGGGAETSSRFMLLKLEISSNVIVHLACMHTFFLVTFRNTRPPFPWLTRSLSLPQDCEA